MTEGKRGRNTRTIDFSIRLVTGRAGNTRAPQLKEISDFVVEERPGVWLLHATAPVKILSASALRYCRRRRRRDESIVYPRRSALTLLDNSFHYPHFTACWP